MIEHAGRIITRTGSMASVYCAPARCRACEQGQGCGAGIFSRLPARNAHALSAQNPHGLPPGAAVILGVEEGALARGAMNLYGWPVVGMLSGALIGSVCGAYLSANQDLSVLIGVLAGIAVGLVAGRSSRASLQPVVLRRAGPAQ